MPNGIFIIDREYTLLLIMGAVNKTERAVDDAIDACLSPLSDACLVGL